MNHELDNRHKLKHKAWHELDMKIEHGHYTRMNLKMANSRLG